MGTEREREREREKRGQQFDITHHCTSCGPLRGGEVAVEFDVGVATPVPRVGCGNATVVI